ncbi:MerR family transcriptional regulator [Streptomyces gamaensis]|uniref:MerR family transcriptional regulator n=1 Tax=Streptomyces gamaensis TaxID=1763542 RepID=A0ABW0Z838_9ACTN
MNDGTLYSIGELARLTGLTVKTIRFRSDTGVVPPTDRTPAGYRLYDQEALARLGLVRTLRLRGAMPHSCEPRIAAAPLVLKLPQRGCPQQA